MEISSQEEFDEYHKKLCSELKEKWSVLNVGKAQKWINMTLKYWMLLGNSRIESIEKNYKFFHIPIDSFVIKDMLNEKINPWSKIENYEDYLYYQKKLRNKKAENPPIIEEFNFYNNH